MEEMINIPEPVLSQGVETCLNMAAMFLKQQWPGLDRSRYWCLVNIDPKNGIIELQIGDKHPNGFEETPFATYRFNNDGTYTKYVNA